MLRGVACRKAAWVSLSTGKIVGSVQCVQEAGIRIGEGCGEGVRPGRPGGCASLLKVKLVKVMNNVWTLSVSERDVARGCV